LYRDILASKGIRGPVPAQLSEDETRVDATIEFDITTNTLVGFCGDKGAQHICSLNGEQVKLPHGPGGE
jgi:hypothetical protein